MRKKLLISYIAIVIVTVIFSVGVSWSRVNVYLFNVYQNELASKTSMAVSMLETRMDNNDFDFQLFADDLSDVSENRVTIIARDGAVLADSDNDADEMENHAGRPEIVAAINGEPASSMRFSDTMKRYFYYYAKSVDTADGEVILRLSLPVTEIENIVYDMIMIIVIGVIIGAAVMILISYGITNLITQPINRLTEAAKKIAAGNYEEKIYISQKDQIGELAEAFNSMTFTLRKKIWELAQKNDEMKSILTSMSNGMAALDEDYRFVLYNDVFLDILKLPIENVTGKPFYEVIRNVSLFELFEQAVESREAFETEVTVKRNGESKVLKIASTPIRATERNGQIIGTLLILTDVTKIRKLENMRRDFVSNVTHELKTPLTSIKGFVDTLKNGAIEDADVAMRFLDIIDIEAERLSTLIQDILILSEIETMGGDKLVDKWQMSDIANEVVEILEPEIKEKDIKVIVRSQENLKSYECNRDRMKQLFINLIDNAVKYTDKGSVVVDITGNARVLAIEVSDTGIGIEKKHLSRIFERFYRVDKGRSRKMGGTGLGLSICKHIVELYNGDIEIESEVGKGTTIRIRLPY